MTRENHTESEKWASWGGKERFPDVGPLYLQVSSPKDKLREVPTLCVLFGFFLSKERGLFM